MIENLTNMTVEELAVVVEAMDRHLDEDIPDSIPPMAQDYARVAKGAEEVGEAIDALIGVTGQNPRKGTYGSMADVYMELCDVALTGLYALQHFTKDAEETMEHLFARMHYHMERVGLDYETERDG